MFEYGVMPPAMFGGMILFLLIGFPVAFSLAAVGLLFGVIGVATGHFEWSLMQVLPLRVFGSNILSNELLLSIPFFTFMGVILEKCGLAEDMLEGLGELFGPLPGGLAYAVILVGAVLGAITGTVAASVIAMAVVSLPVMIRYGYNMRLATGVIAASGTITQLIPPSLVLIVLADQLNATVGDMYLGAIGPSLIQLAIFVVFIALVSIFRPHTMPALPPEARHGTVAQLLWRVAKGIVPSLVLIFLVLGTIFLGLATSTEAGAMGAVGAMILAALHGRLTFGLVRQGMQGTMRITAMVMFILIGSTVFSLVFQGMDGGLWIKHLLSQLPGGEIGFLIFVNIFIFLLAFFLDFFEIAFIVIPMLTPAVQELGINIVWFGVLICVNLQTSFMHPPFGFALFYLRGVAPRSVRSIDIYLGAVPWVLLQLMLVAIVIFWPQTVTSFLRQEAVFDPATIEINVPAPGGEGFAVPSFGAPSFGAPSFGAPPAGEAPAVPSFGAPPAGEAPPPPSFGAPPAGEAPPPRSWGAPPAGEAPPLPSFGAPPADAPAAPSFGADPPLATPAQ